MKSSNIKLYKLSNTLFIPKYTESFNAGYLSTEHLLWLRSIAVLPDFLRKHNCGKLPGDEDWNIVRTMKKMKINQQ